MGNIKRKYVSSLSYRCNDNWQVLAWNIKRGRTSAKASWSWFSTWQWSWCCPSPTLPVLWRPTMDQTLECWAILVYNPTICSGCHSIISIIPIIHLTIYSLLLWLLSTLFLFLSYLKPPIHFFNLENTWIMFFSRQYLQFSFYSTHNGGFKTVCTFFVPPPKKKNTL